MNTLIKTLLLTLALATTNAAAAPDHKKNKNKEQKKTQTAGKAGSGVCSTDDFQLSSAGSDNVTVLGCSGAHRGNDKVNDADWLSDKSVWDDADTLVTSGGKSTNVRWDYLAKYQPDGTITDGSNSAFDLNFTGCSDKKGKSTQCNSDATSFNMSMVFDSLNFTDMMYDQFVFIAKAGNYHSLYQVQVLNGISSLTGDLSTVSKNGLSHLSVWAAKTQQVPPRPTVSVDAPASALLMLFALGLIAIRKKPSPIA